MAARLFLIAASLYTGILTFTSLIKLGKISVGEFNPTDKFLHFVAYFGLVVVWQAYFMFRDLLGKYKVNLLKVLVGSLLFGILIEVLQGVLTSYREPDWYDIVANSFGAGVAAILLSLLEKNLRRIKK